MSDAESAALNLLRAGGNPAQLRVLRTLWIIQSYYTLRNAA